MRFSNWDVLLFPDDLKTPMQEFKTVCHVIQDPDFISDLTNDSNTIFEGSLPQQLPTVAAFIASLPQGDPFRVSIHSWEALLPISKAARAVSKPNRFYEARVVIDGVRVAGKLFPYNGPWPQVIDMSLQYDKAGAQDRLRFPMFRQEVMSQTLWSAAEIIGRIKVTITEGYLRGPNIMPFLPLKNLVTFAFQHAPLHVLENSGIAWPNQRMWNTTCQPYYNTPSPVKNDYTEADLHAHSPRRHSASVGKPASVMSMESVHMLGPATILSGGSGPMPFPPMARFGHEPIDPVWSHPPMETDPFMGSGPQPLLHRFTVSEDHSMPDYSRSLTSASGQQSNFPTHGNAFTNSIGTAFQNNTGIEELVQTLRSNMDQQFQGLVPPPNTHANSPLNQVPSHGPTEINSISPYGASNLHPASHGMPENMDQITKTPVYGTHITGTATPTHHNKPSPRVGSGIKGRKEGHASDVDLSVRGKRHVSNAFTRTAAQENSAGGAMANSSAAISSEGKRKRANMSLTLSDHDVAAASPTRKVSKRKGSKNTDEMSADLADERRRTPLEELENL